MEKQDAQRIAAMFETIINANMTTTLEYEVREAYDNGCEDYHVYIKASSTIFEKDFLLMLGFGEIVHRCIRYNTYDREWEIW